MKHTLQIIAAVLCFTLIFTVFLTGCSKQEQPSDGTSEVPTESKNTPDESQTEPSETTEPVTEPIEEPAEPLDMDTFIQKLAEEYPNASAEELCTEIQKSTYFTLYRPLSIDYYIPGFSNYKPDCIDDSYAIVHNGTESFVLVFKTKVGTDVNAFISELNKNLSKNWRHDGEENDPDTVFAKAIDGIVFFALYHSDIQPITVYAKTPEEYVNIFRNYCQKNPGSDCMTITSYLAPLQTFGCDLCVYKASEGVLKGFGETVTGFSDGAVFCPEYDPSAFLGYVFRVQDINSVDSFISQLRQKANLAYNVCIVLKNITIEAEGNYVLFMMYGTD